MDKIILRTILFFFVLIVSLSIVYAPAGGGNCASNTNIVSCINYATAFCGWDDSANSCITCSDYNTQNGGDQTSCLSKNACYWREDNEICLTCYALNSTICNTQQYCGWEGINCLSCAYLSQSDCESSINCIWNSASCVGKPFNASSSFPTSYGSTDLTSVSDPSSVSNLVLANSEGSIEWVGNVNTQYQDFNTHITIGTGFVSIDAANLDSSINSSANVSIHVAGCDSWTIYYANHTVTSLAQLESEGVVVGTEIAG